MYEIHTLSSSKLSETVSKKNYSDTGSSPEIKNVHCGNIYNRKIAGEKGNAYKTKSAAKYSVNIQWINSGYNIV